MKKFILLFFFLSLPLVSFSFKLSKEAKQEADFFNTFLKASYALREGDPKSFVYLQKALESQPDSKYLKRLLVSAILVNGKLEEATPYIDFINQGENSAEDWSIYGAYQWKSGDKEGAKKSYEEALLLEPENTNILYQYVLLLSTFPPEIVAEKFSLLAKEYPDLASDAYTEVGHLFLRKQNFEKALEYYNKAVEVDPENVEPRLGRGEIYEKTSQFFLMLHEFEELEKMGYANAGTLSRMGSVFFLVKDYDTAEKYFLKAKKMFNGDAPSAYFLALLSERKGDFSRAAGYLREASDYSVNPAKQLQVAFYLKRLNQPKESLKVLRKAYQNFPDNIEISYFYALALNDAKKYKKAKKILQKLLQEAPLYDEARLQYAYVLESLQDYREMETELNTLLERQPNNTAALNLYAYSLYKRGEELQKAQEVISHALEINPQDYAFMDTQAWVYFKQGNLSAAENLLENIPQEFFKENPEVAYHLGAVYFEQGKYEQAKPLLKMAVPFQKEAKKLYKKLPKKAAR
jgi:tetratricopeptide (TPR) repeat protein